MNHFAQQRHPLHAACSLQDAACKTQPAACSMQTAPKHDDWLVFDGRKYEFKAIEKFEFGTAWVITARSMLGDVPEQIHPLSTDHLLELTQTVTATV